MLQQASQEIHDEYGAAFTEAKLKSPSWQWWNRFLYAT